MKSKTVKLDITKTIITHADLLAERHASYVSEFVTRANDELYAILADIFQLYEQVESSKQRQALIKAMREHLRENYGIKTQANTKLTALVTKYVTRASRKTAHVYSRVLEVAIANGTTSAGLVAFIKLKGGIDKLRMSVVSAETRKQELAQNKHWQQSMRSQLSCKQSVGTVTFAQGAQLPHAKDVSFIHLLCQLNTATNQHEVVGVMYPSSNLEAQAMEEYMIMLSVAAVSDDHTKFYQQCKELGLNMDLIQRWMTSNGIADAATAKALAVKLATAAQPPLAANHEWPKAA